MSLMQIKILVLLSKIIRNQTIHPCKIGLLDR
jgi:hypothetical protein